MAAPADPGVAGAGGRDSAAGPLLAGVIVLTVLAVLLGARYHSDANRLALLRGAGRAEIFHAFLARTASGRLVTAAPSTHCRASVFAAFVGARARRQEAIWRSVLGTAGEGLAPCSYAYCAGCPTQRGGPTLIDRAAYEPALAFAHLATARLVEVEDGRWQRSLFFPEPDSRRAAGRDLRTALAEFAKPQARAGPPQGRGTGS